MQEQDQIRRENNLRGWLERKIPGAQNLRVLEFEKSQSGTSNETWFLTANWREAGMEKDMQLVVRWAPEAMQLLHTYDLMAQFRILQGLEGSDVPVPRALWFEEDEKVLGNPFFVMEKIDGEVLDLDPGSNGYHKLCEATAQERRHIWRQTVESIARVHAVDWRQRGLGFLRGSDGGASSLDQEIGWWQDLMAFSRADVPVIAEAFAWASQHRYQPEHTGLCWGDARQGNLIFRDGEVVAVLDWEMAYIGPPECDVMYLCVMTETMNRLHGLARLEGVPDTAETCAYYESITGTRLEHLHCHEVIATLKSAVGLCRAGAVLEEAGAGGFPPGFFTDNHATQRLEELLGRQSDH